MVEFVIGIFVGGLLYWLLFCHKKPSGTFVIDLSDPLQEETFRIDMDDSLNDIYTKKQIVLKVKVYENDYDIA